MELLSPKIIVLLGDVAVKQFFPQTGLAAAHGKVLTKNGRRFFPTYHPAAVIYNRGLKETLTGDFRALASEASGSPGDGGPPRETS